MLFLTDISNVVDFNFDAVAKDMLAAMKEVLCGNWPKVESAARQFVRGKERRFKLLSGSYLKGEITQQEFALYLEDEKRIFEAEIEALKVVSKALAQKVVNAAIDVFVKAVRAAV